MLLALVISAALVILFYTGMLSWYAFSFKRFRESIVDNGELVPVKASVIIPVRNEALNLHTLFQDLSAQDQNDRDYEVIFVDDHSTDRSGILLEEFCGEHSNCRLVRLRDGFTGKKQAIAEGVKAATGDWIIQADADCRLPVGFISGHAAFAAKGADLVAGPVLVRPGRRLWERFEALEHFSLVATGLAAAAAGRPVMCSGANLSYGKGTYLESSAKLMAVPHASGDDVFLLAEAKKHKKRIVFTAAPGMMVTTSPTFGPVAFLQQRIRWGSKARLYTDPDMLLVSVLVWLANTALAGLLIASLFAKGMVWIFLPALVLKSLSEYQLLRGIADRLGQQSLLRIFPVAALFYYFYIAIAGILAMTGTFTWKERRHNGL